MPKVRGTVPNVINGVSQQAPSLRLTSQAEIDTNVYPLIVDGLTQRPPSQHQAQCGNNDIDSDAFVHHILRDELEKYSVFIENDGTVRVFDFAGVEKTVTDNSGTYLDSVVSAQTDIQALTIADHTFIINKKEVVAAGTATSAAQDASGYVWVKQGNYGHDYKAFIDGVEEAAYQTPDGGSAADSISIRTNFIADELRNDLVAGGFHATVWATTRYANTLFITNDTDDFDLSAEDSLGDTSIIAGKDKVTALSDLPPHNKGGYKVKISGSDSEEADDYWVEFQWQGTNSSRGIYKETIAPDTVLGLDATTMPHVLVRESDGTFTLEPAPWNDRQVGDATSNPDPSFVGSVIKDITFHRNRLGLVTADNLILSRNGDFYNFYRTTLTALLDTDPIDIAASHTKVTILEHAVPYQDELILFSGRTQFRVAGNELLSPTSVSARPLTEMSAEASFPPVPSGNHLYFVNEGDYFSHLYEYYYDKNTEIAEADNISAHAPNYVPAGVFKIAAAHDLSLIALPTTGDPSSLYLYKYYVANREKLQSAWIKWEFNCDRIAAVDFDGKQLVVTVRRGTDYFIEKLNCEEGQGEAIHLDRRVGLLTGVYNATTKETTFTAPYTVDADLKVVTGTGGPLPLGVELDREADDTIVIDGDHSTQPILFGWPYTMRHRFSPFYQRAGQDQTAVTDGRLQVHGLTIEYSSTAYFKVEVTPELRAKRSYVFAGSIAGDAESFTGALPANNGHFAVPIKSRNDRVKIDIVNDTWRPTAINSAAWRGIFNPLSREK